jgi:hypothetical protein
MPQMAIKFLLHTFSWLDLLSVLFISTTCFAENVFIRPSENVTCEFRPCLTLDELAKNLMEYIESDSDLENITLIIFSTGNHQLHHQLHLKNVSNVALVSVNETHDNVFITLINKSVNIMWTDCNNIIIADVIFKTGIDHDSEDTRILRQIPILAFQRTNGSLSHSYFCAWIYCSGINCRN